MKLALKCCRSRSRNRQAYTLMEIMIVVLIIGLLAVVAFPHFSKSRETARKKQAEMDLEMLSNAMLQLAWDTGKWPSGMARTAAGDPELWDLTTASAGLLQASSDFSEWKGPYVRDIPLDPWGMPYFFDSDYRINGVNKIVVGSFGPNREGRNMYDNDDIYVILK